jgi:hypothetical protein
MKTKRTGTGGKVRVFSPDNEHTQTEITVRGFPRNDHSNGRGDAGWVSVEVERIGFSVSTQMEIANAIKMRDALSEAIVQATEAHACNRTYCFDCKRNPDGRYGVP